MPDSFRIAGVQMDVAFADREANLRAIEAALRPLASQGVRLAVFPECAIPGYCFDSLDEARKYAEPLPGPSTSRLAETCRELGIFVAVGLLEADGDRVFNACVLVGPAGLVGSYRKIHLPFLGVDRFTTPGDRPFAVYDAGGLRVGLNICYDAAFPEASRTMALAGADLIVLPTNWPPGAQCTAEFVINTRAMENHVYYLAVNRIGTERGFRFIGQSKFCGPDGRSIAEASDEEPEVLIGDVDVQLARRKKIVRVLKLHEIDRFADRRPEMYGKLVEPVEPRNESPGER